MRKIISNYKTKYYITDEGYIGRYDIEGFEVSKQWKCCGAVRYNNFGHQVEFIALPALLEGKITGSEWQHKNGKQRWHIVDKDHGTQRVWMNPSHYLL
jgi:hypothetical protein